MADDSAGIEVGSGRKGRRSGAARLRSIEDLDGRTTASRKARQLLSGIESDLGGADLLSVGQRQLAQRAALLGALIEDAEARWAAGESIDIDPYLRAVGVQRRVLATLGLERRARDVTPSEDLQSYLSARRRVAEAAGEPLEVRSPVDFDEIAGEPRP